MLGFLIVYLKGLRIMMFQLSGYYHTTDHAQKGFGVLSVKFRGFRVLDAEFISPKSVHFWFYSG